MRYVWDIMVGNNRVTTFGETEPSAEDIARHGARAFKIRRRLHPTTTEREAMRRDELYAKGYPSEREQLDGLVELSHKLNFAAGEGINGAGEGDLVKDATTFITVLDRRTQVEGDAVL